MICEKHDRDMDLHCETCVAVQCAIITAKVAAATFVIGIVAGWVLRWIW